MATVLETDDEIEITLGDEVFEVGIKILYAGALVGTAFGYDDDTRYELRGTEIHTEPVLEFVYARGGKVDAQGHWIDDEMRELHGSNITAEMRREVYASLDEGNELYYPHIFR